MLEESKFENILSSLRVRKGKAWTQQKTADELGVSVRTYKGWERGERVPDHRDLKNIAVLFSLDTAAEAELYLAASKAPPKIQNLPFPRNPFFTGREEHLERLREQLQATGTTAITQPICISGLAGIGKTQLVLEYAYRWYPEVYRAVLWVSASDKTALEAGYVKLAHRLELPNLDERDLDRIVQAVKDWLESHTNWLLIMDNADDLQLARSFFPEAHHGHILLTTRSQIVGNIARQIEISQMEPEEGLLFVLRRSAVLQDEAKLDTVAADIRESAIQLVELLGGHPLALDQAGAYIEETEVSFADYISLYNDARSFLLNRRGELDGGYSEHPEAVATTFELCFTKARVRHQLATDILHFCAFLQPDTIPEELFQHVNKFRFNKTEFREGIIALRRYSLIKRNAQENIYSMHRIFSIHRLVQAVLIDAMNPNLQKQWRERVVYAVRAAFPPEAEFKNWRQCERLLPHVLICAMWTEDESAPKVEIAWLSKIAAHYLVERGQYTEAEILFSRILPIYEQYFGVEQQSTASLQNSLAYLYQRQGKYDLAEPLYKQAIAILEKQLGAEHPSTTRALNNLSNLYIMQRKYDLAEPIILRLCSFLESQLGAEHPDTLRSLSNLAAIYRHQRKYAQAEPLQVREHSIRESQLGAEDPNTALSLLRLAGLYQLQGKYEQAETLCRRALAVLENSLGAVHPITAMALHGLASILQDQGLHEQSEAFYQRSLNIQKQQLGEAHPDTLSTKKKYAKLLHSIGRDAEAAALEATNEPRA